VELGQASTYAVLSGASVGNTENAPGAPHTTLRGDLGVNANAQPTGFPPGVVTGTTRVGASTAQAYADLLAAYEGVAARTGGTAFGGDLAGLTLTPGLYSTAAAVSNTGTVTLDGGGNPNAVFVFKIGGALAMAAGARVTLTNGTRASRVFWQVNGAGSVGANGKFAGTLMAHDAVAMGAGTLVNGRALALTGAVSLNANEFYSAPPVVTVAGGATAITNHTTPTISGTTDVVAPGVVTVTIAGQTLTATPSEGVWAVTSAILANGTYPVVASVSDGAGNPGSTTQQLTINTVLPVVTIDGGPSVTTNNPTRTIAGTSDVAPGTVVRVTVDSQTLTALVQSAGTWNVTPTALTDGARTVTASVTDPAGNNGTNSQTLTVNTVAPTVIINGGANALTNNARPNISGTANVAPGTTVTVTLADQTLTGLVQGGGWSVTAAALSDGPHRVVMSVSDAAGNWASYTQTLTVDTVSPFVAITGGATATASSLSPTIAGTSDAAPGTIVTVSIAGQTLTTLVQANGTWNATAFPVHEGTWLVVASAADPAGNVGTARQTLTVAAHPLSGAAGGSGGIVSTGGSSPVTLSLSAARYSAARGTRVQVPFLLSGPAKVTLTVLRGKKVVARLSTIRRKAGRGSLTWDGKIKGKLAPRGAYKIIVRVVSRSGASARVAATLRIT
jgi:Ice-binding-like/Bacterial Ig-like domain